ncbi:ribosomal protein S12 methylthiotransferase accessory factor [Candidatus Magnetomoraceae bacterium gMMP-1]
MIEKSVYDRMSYELRFTETSSGTGYFFCAPELILSYDSCLSYLKNHPYDEFMHNHILKILGTFDEERVKDLIISTKSDDLFFIAFLYELCMINEKFSHLIKYFQDQVKLFSSNTPMIYIKSSLLDDQKFHFKWIKIIKRNILEHRPLPSLNKTGLPLLFSKEQLAKNDHIVHIKDIFYPNPIPSESSLPLPEETATHALESLEKIGILEGGLEMRHVSSLSPYGLLRQWGFSVNIKNGRHNYRLSGAQTSYGKGLSLPAARASYSMEIVERCSAFADFEDESVVGYKKDYPLIHARYTDIADGEISVLNPNDLNLEVPYENEKLYWMQAEQKSANGLNPILIPAQCVFMFCNLDEICLSSGFGSTGLASGNTLEEAKVSALLEFIERDSEIITPYDPEKCFKITTNDQYIGMLLEDYKNKEIHLQFQDITQEFGLPCYKCFVVGPGGEIVKGSCAHLSGKHALLSAMTETPYPYPSSPHSKQVPDSLPVLNLEELPDYSTKSPDLNLNILEKLLTANNFYPIYVDLTRQDLGIPVVRALIPNMQLIMDYDFLSRVPFRLFRNYMDFGRKKSL